MTKKKYMKPALNTEELAVEELLRFNSVVTVGLDDTTLEKDETPGDIWDNAMGRRDLGDKDDEW